MAGRKKSSQTDRTPPYSFLVDHRHFCSKTKKTSEMVEQLLCACEREKRIWLTLFSSALYVLQNQHKISNFCRLHAPAKNLNLTFGKKQSYIISRVFVQYFTRFHMPYFMQYFCPSSVSCAEYCQSFLEVPSVASFFCSPGGE